MHHVSFLGEIYQKTRHGKSAKRQRPIASSKSLLRALCCAFFRSAVKKITNSKTKINKKNTKSKTCPKTKDRVLARKNAPGASKNRVLARKDRDLSVQKAPKNRKKRTKTKKKHTQKMCTHIRLGRGWAVSGQACVRLLQTLTGDSVCNHLPGQANASYCGDNVLKEEQRRNCLQRWHDEKLCQSSKRLVKLSKMSQTPLCGFLHTLKINKSVAFPCRLTSGYTYLEPQLGHV